MIKEAALKRLEMPAVMHERQEINMVLREDPDIDGHDESSFVFTDISTSDTDRVIFKHFHAYQCSDYIRQWSMNQ